MLNRVNLFDNIGGIGQVIMKTPVIRFKHIVDYLIQRHTVSNRFEDDVEGDGNGPLEYYTLKDGLVYRGTLEFYNKSLGIGCIQCWHNRNIQIFTNTENLVKSGLTNEHLVDFPKKYKYCVTFKINSFFSEGKPIKQAYDLNFSFIN